MVVTAGKGSTDRWTCALARLWLVLVIQKGRLIVFQRANILNVNSVPEKVQEVGSDPTFPGVFSNAMIFESFVNRVQMLEMRFRCPDLRSSNRQHDKRYNWEKQLQS